MKVEWTDYDDGSASARVGQFCLSVPAPTDYERPRDLWHSSVILPGKPWPYSMKAAQDVSTRAEAKRCAEKLFARILKAAAEIDHG